MKKLLILPIVVIVFSLQGCSWIIRFFISNPTNEAVTVEMKLTDAPGSFPIFHYPHHYYGKLHTYKLSKGASVEWEGAIETKVDTLEKYSHFRFEIPPHTAVEIGQLQNDNYEKHDQYFINGRTFNIEKISISSKKLEIVPSTFDKYFRKGENKEVYFVL